jgi:hypothetical protein
MRDRPPRCYFDSGHLGDVQVDCTHRNRLQSARRGEDYSAHNHAYRSLSWVRRKLGNRYV